MDLEGKSKPRKNRGNKTGRGSQCEERQNAAIHHQIILFELGSKAPPEMETKHMEVDTTNTIKRAKRSAMELADD
ncbi:hypothetical protein PR202_ga26933 [Eleusine coracana subsp. coracana]|uniref:Uncharacterized protein n=1 Tax=Eleusine coracana subsp. coracana TaxID=191504 RepID=A0AAV5DF03_ELECO|nr:hypothetical protein PR202_ga26933 [Eleusine coracana subsp. coracana]